MQQQLHAADLGLHKPARGWIANPPPRRYSQHTGRSIICPAAPAARSESARKPNNQRNKQRPRRQQKGGAQIRAQPALSTNNTGPWRLFEVTVPYADDPGKDDVSVHDQLCSAVAKALGCAVPTLPEAAITIVRKSFDARKQKRFVYVVDVDPEAVAAAGARKLQPRPGQLDRLPYDPSDPASSSPSSSGGSSSSSSSSPRKDPVVVVGSGPAGLFAALAAAEAGLPVLLLERGQPVDVRGRDIGALMVRKKLDPESNLCYGEGGAGTWSDGKLTTRIGRNSDPVRRVLQTLVQLGAPDSILVTGKPHLGTDRLVRILKAFRGHLQALGAEVRFGCKVQEVMVQQGQVTGVKLADGTEVRASKVVLAVGHSARAMYDALHAVDVAMAPKPFALGFRIEHPQELINEIQYGQLDAQEVQRGKGRMPVADYSLATTFDASYLPGAAAAGAGAAAAGEGGEGREFKGKSWQQQPGSGGRRGVFSFCMCPGGQVVPTSTTPEELCVNGMSFSRRNSQWANAALVVSVGPEDWGHLQHKDVLAGVAMQQEMERAAAVMGGGGFVAPVQRVTDFMAGELSTGTLPSSSYRLGVRSGPLHELYSPAITAALRKALRRFDRSLPGFISEAGLLHGVETRTSAPVRIERSDDCQSVSVRGLYPCGEGAGYAGGIVSAAVDGLRVGEALVREVSGVAADAGEAGRMKGMGALSKY